MPTVTSVTIAYSDGTSQVVTPAAAPVTPQTVIVPLGVDVILQAAAPVAPSA